VALKRLDGKVILVVENEPLVALDVVKALRAAGARVLCAGYLESGLCTTEHPKLSATVIDLHLGDGSGTVICSRLRERGIPFVIHTGYPPMLVAREWLDVPAISKPAQTDQIISALIGALR
jgi:ActR/RegA family two-component response regulator